MAITILDLAKFRGLDGNSMGSFDRVGLPMLGGCSVCEATVAAYNAAPTTTGYLMCAESCVGDHGFETVEEANLALFPEEYTWKGVRS